MKEEFIKKYGLFIFLCIVVVIICAFVIDKNVKPNFSKLMNKENIRFTKTIKTNDYSFLDRFDVNGTIYKYNDSVIVNGYKGYIYYVRGNNNLNIYQVRIDTIQNDPNVPIIAQIKESMDKLEKGMVDSFNNKLVLSNEEFDRESEYKFDTSVEEKIYNEKMIYTKFFEDSNERYNINYYMENDYLVCEMVKFIK